MTKALYKKRNLTKSQTNHNLPGRLQYIRKLNNLSQRNLAKTAQLSPGFIAQLEMGKASLSLNSLHRLAKALRVSPCYLITDCDSITDCDTKTKTTSALVNILQDSNARDLLMSVSGFTDVQINIILNFVALVKKVRKS